MKVLGLTGLKQSGKDTCLELLTKYLAPLPVVRLGFADALKEDICKMVGCDLDFLLKHKDNFRLLMQTYGTEVRRELFGKDYWVKRAGKTLLELAELEVPPYLVVFPDVRFLNEAEFVTSIGGKIWKVVRQIMNTDTHASETEQSQIKCDSFVCNTTSIVALENEVQLAWMRTFPEIKTSIKHNNNKYV